MRNIYRTYGLTLESDLPVTGLTQFLDAALPPDIQLHFATIPGWVVQALSLPVTSLRVRPSSRNPADDSFTVSEFADRRFFLLTYGDGTRFLMDAAVTRIWGEPGPGLSHDDLFIYLLGPVMGFALRQRGITTLHASAVSFRGRAIALVGEAGAGKSTTAAAMALSGWPVLCEDVCALREAAGEFQVLPAYPRVCLWPDSVDILFASRDALPVMVPGWDKRFLPLDGSLANFASTCLPLAAILLLSERSDADSAPRIETISQRDAVLELVQNTYMNWYLDRRQRAGEFDALTRLLPQVACLRVIPSSDPARLPALVELIEGKVLDLATSDKSQVPGAASQNV